MNKHRAGAKGEPGPLNFGGLAPLLLLIHITNIHLNYYFFTKSLKVLLNNKI